MSEIIELKKPKPKYKKRWVWLIGIIIIVNMSGGEDQPNQSTQKSSTLPLTTKKALAHHLVTAQPKSEHNKEELPSHKTSMNKAEFDQLKMKMTYEEAKAIIGGLGEAMSESGSPGERLHTVMYQYEGEGDPGAKAYLMFQGNQLVNKDQFGLK
ncbi:hypothetical protein [Ammoniphilus sp. 3BR4]|uniref:hypothetical protein n=1 Tax=Ammoniphilus sp. 3BR4 TaxID=3158265 RepID=UPI003467821D